MDVVGLFVGIGGIEIGIDAAGNTPVRFCEVMPEARSVLTHNFPDLAINQDVRRMVKLPKADILAAGFPCQNLSIAGNKEGISGKNSSLVNEIFRLIENNYRPRYVVIENVANLITLHKGEALKYITERFNQLGYNWAYRLVDPRSFGIPQRRPRFVMVASTEMHPKDILFPINEDIDAVIQEKPIGELSDAYGFYWTEGRLGIGWANNSIPPLKCGSTLGLPSAPAIWDVRNNFFGTPTIEDAERLQGFPENWTLPIELDGFKRNQRWKLVGNAVNTRVSQWIGEVITNQNIQLIPEDRIFEADLRKLPKAGFGYRDRIMGVRASEYPLGVHYTPILDFLNHPLIPLSQKATIGFLNRTRQSTNVVYPEYFTNSILQYLRNQYGYEE